MLMLPGPDTKWVGVLLISKICCLEAIAKNKGFQPDFGRKTLFVEGETKTI